MKSSIIAIITASVLSTNAFADPIKDLHDRVDETYDKVNAVQDEMRDGDKAISDRLTAVQKTLHEEGILRAESDVIVGKNANKYTDKSVAKEKAEREKDRDIMTSAINNNASNIAKNSESIESNTNRIQALESWKNNIDDRLNSMDDKFSDGIAGVAAMSNIPTPAVAGSTTVGAGVGNFSSSTAVAVGISSYGHNGVSVKASVATTFNETIVGGGIGYTW
ncbi:MAG: YadA C-terminal domain-containing protein [Bacilli bacterium]